MKLSVITVNYNDEKGLQRTIDSVVAQTSRNDLEFIVVDGASTDGSVQLLERCSESIDNWISEPDSGIYNAMNKGVAMSTGEYCLFLNSGDFFHDNNVVAELLPLLNGQDLLVGRVFMADYNYYSPKLDDRLTYLYLFSDGIYHQASIIKTNTLRNRPYDESYRICADQKFLAELLVLDNCSYTSVDLVISDYDVHGISSVNVDQRESENRRWRTELLPPRVILDYQKFINGSDYEDSPYDLFYRSLKVNHKRLGRFIYRMNVRLLRLYSIINKHAAFSRNHPLDMD